MIMHRFFETIHEIVRYLRQYKSRTFLTMFGIIWGTMTVIVLLAFGVGVRKSMSKNMHGMGDGIAIVWPGRTSIPFQGYGRNRNIRFRVEDTELLRKEVEELLFISPEYSKWDLPIRVGEQIKKTNVAGVIPEYGPMRNIWPQVGGRWLNDLDLKERKRVAFIGNKLNDFLFGEGTNGVGKYILIGETPFLVIGVMRKKTQPSSYTTRDQDRICIPTTTFESLFGDRYLHNMIYKVKNPKLYKTAQQRLYEVLGKKYTFDPKDKETLGIWDTTEMDKFIVSFSLGMKIFLGLIGTITLIVGGIGLANIMYVVVQERIREIGIRRSVGAKKNDILGQFLFESFLIISVSAVIGFIMAFIIIQLVALLPIEEYVGRPELSASVAITTILILSLVGFLAGYFPARKASKLIVVDCLRY